MLETFFAMQILDCTYVYMSLASASQGKKFGAFLCIKTGGYIGFLNCQILVTCGHEGGTSFFVPNRGHVVYGQPLRYNSKIFVSCRYDFGVSLKKCVA